MKCAQTTRLEYYAKEECLASRKEGTEVQPFKSRCILFVNGGYFVVVAGVDGYVIVLVRCLLCILLIWWCCKRRETRAVFREVNLDDDVTVVV